MPDTKVEPVPAHVAARQQRLRDALRENLKRRKSQSRGRADPPGEPTSRKASQDLGAGVTAGMDHAETDRQTRDV